MYKLKCLQNMRAIPEKFGEGSTKNLRIKNILASLMFEPVKLKTEGISSTSYAKVNAILIPFYYSAEHSTTTENRATASSKQSILYCDMSQYARLEP